MMTMRTDAVYSASICLMLALITGVGKTTTNATAGFCAPQAKGASAPANKADLVDFSSASNEPVAGELLRESRFYR
jgi:hypothetical protein